VSYGADGLALLAKEYEANLAVEDMLKGRYDKEVKD
jgi:hypothetical protein